MATNVINAPASAAATTNDSTTGGVAVMEPAINAGTTTSTAKKGGKKGGKSKPKATGNIASLAERAEAAMPEGGSASMTAQQLGVLDDLAAKDINLRNPEVPKGERIIAKDAALMVLIGVGLGEKSGGHGPYVRSANIALLKTHLGKKTITRGDITADNLVAILVKPDYQTQATKALDTYVAGLKADAIESTIETRVKSKAKALKWITNGLHANYLTAIRVWMNLGTTVKFGKIEMPLNRALGVAYGRNITAAELMGELKKAATPASATPAAA